MAILTLLAIGFAASIFADDPPPPEEPYIASENDDLDGDDIKDTVLASPDGTSTQPRGEVEIRSGSNGQLLVTIRGQTDGDKFGFSVAIIKDTNLDTHKDIIIGAPQDDQDGPPGTPVGRAYVFRGPFTDSGPILITAENATFTFASPDANDFDFGEKVGSIYDLDGDGANDLRIRAWFYDEEVPPNLNSHTYIVSGLTGAPLYQITGDEPFDPWAEVAGDADSDGDVDQDDFDIVTQNLGQPASPGNGDVNGDGVVDGADLAIVQANMGESLFDDIVIGGGGGSGGGTVCTPGQNIPDGFHCVPICSQQSSILLPINVKPQCTGVMICPGPGCVMLISPGHEPCLGNCLPSVVCVFSRIDFSSIVPWCGADVFSWSVPSGLVMKYASSDPRVFPARFVSVGTTRIHGGHDCCSGYCTDQVQTLSVWIDSDSDGLPDALEEELGLNPFNADSDGNGVPDGQEPANTGTGMTNLQQLGSGTWPGLWNGINSVGMGSALPQYNGLAGNGNVATGPPPACEQCDHHINYAIVDGDQVPIVDGQPLYVCPGSTLQFHLSNCQPQSDDYWIVTGDPGSGGTLPGFDGDPGQDRISPPIVVPPGNGGSSGGSGGGAGGGGSGGSSGGSGGSAGEPCGSAFSVTGLTFFPGVVCSDTVQIVPVCVDLDVDSDNDNGYDAPASTPVEDEIEDQLDQIGKMILVNNTDRDGDGIPGFADGFNFNSELESDNDSPADRFVPLRLKLPMGFDYFSDRIKFTYQHSLPTDVQVLQTNDVSMYQPGAGLLRLWLKDGGEQRNGQPIESGGDFIRSGPLYHPSDLGFSEGEIDEITLWVEAVRPSQSLGDARIVVEVGDCGQDAVRLTAYGTQIVNITPAGELDEPGLPLLSRPTPVISTSAFDLVNVRTAVDNSKIVADLTIAATVQDALSNLIADEEEGLISEVYVYLNGEPALVTNEGEATPVPVIYTKGSGGQEMLAQYPYEGNFTVTISGLEVQPGWNTVQVIAENSRGYSGYVEQAFEVRPIAPPDTIVGLWLQFYDEDTLGVILNVDGGGQLLADHYELIGPGIYQHAIIPGAYIQVPTDLEPSASTLFVAKVTHPDFELDNLLITVTRTSEIDPIFQGERLVEEHHRTDWTGYTFELNPITVAGGSNGGAFHPFLIEVIGPQELVDLIQDVSVESTFQNIDGQTVSWGRLYEVVQHQERRFLCLPGHALPEVMLALPSQTLEEMYNQQYGEWREGTWHFVEGFGQGFIDTGVDLVDSAGAVAKAGWHILKNYNAISVGWRIITGGGILTEEDQQRISVAWDLLNAVGSVAWDLIQANQQVAYSVLTGDMESLAELGDDERRALQISMELLDAVREGLAELELDDYETGRIAGRVTGEVTLAIVTAGVGTVASKSATGVAVINKLASLPFIPQAIKTRLLAKTAHYETLAASIAKEGETVASVIARIKALEPELSHWETFVRLLEVSNSAGARKAVDPHMIDVVRGLMNAMYGDAVAGGVVDLAKVKKWIELDEFRFPSPNPPADYIGRRLWHLDLQNHHTVPKEWAKVLYENAHGIGAVPPGGWDAWLNDMPGILLERPEHVGGTSSFHNILQQRLPTGSTTNSASIISELEAAYIEWNSELGQNVWSVATKWLQSQGLP